MMGKFRDHSRPETKCDIGPLRLCPSDRSRFVILLPSGLEAKIFLTLHLFQGVNLIGNQFLFNKLRLPRPSPSGMPGSALPKVQHTCACPVFFCVGRVLTQECQGITQLSSAPCHRWYFNYASPSRGTCLGLWISLRALEARRGREVNSRWAPEP